MNNYIIFLVIFIVIIFIALFILFKFRTKKNKFSSEKISFFEKQINKTIANWSSKEQIIDIDKLFAKILLEAWYNWTFWEILKLNPKEISDINKVWELHKLRNKLVHDYDLLSEKVLKQKASDYKIQIKKLLNYFK